MSRNQETDSASALVKEIFGKGISGAARMHYGERLRTNYLHKKNEEKIPKSYRWHSGDGERQRSHITINAKHYFQNLLLLDSLFERPKKVFEILGDEKQTNEARLAYANQQIQQRRGELRPLLEQTQAVLDDSQPWESLPDDFDLYRDPLAALLDNPKEVTEKKPRGESWKFPMADKIRRIEESPEWQDGDVEKAAERAMCYHEMGNTDLAHLQIDEELAQHPEEPVLYYVKAVLLMEGASHHWKQSFLHRELGAQGVALTGEEHWHEEQAFDQATAAMSKGLQALEQLLACYQYWNDRELPGWALCRSFNAKLRLMQEIIKRGCFHLHIADGCGLADRVEQALTEFALKLNEDDSFNNLFYLPKYFGALLGYWRLSRQFCEESYKASVVKWYAEVQGSLDRPKEGIGRDWQRYECVLGGYMEFHRSWGNDWPSMIVAAYDGQELGGALHIAKASGSFLQQVDELYAVQLSDQSLWKRIQFEWQRLMDEDCDTPWKRIQVCQKTLQQLQWSDTDFSKRWWGYWKYAELRCHFDAALLLVDEDKRLASAHVEYVSEQLDEYPNMVTKVATHFTLIEYMDDEEYPRQSEILGHSINVFVLEEREATEGRDGWSGLSAWDSMSDVVFRVSGWEFMPTPKIVERYHMVCKKLMVLKGSPFERLQTYLYTRKARMMEEGVT